MGWFARGLRRLFRVTDLLDFLFLCFPGWKVLTLVRESHVSEPHNLKTYDPFPIVRAWWADAQLGNLSQELAVSTHFYHFHNVGLSANRRGGFLRSRRELIVPDNGLPGPSRVFFASSDVAGIVDQAKNRVLTVRARSAEHLTRGVFAGSMAPHNWFHWIIDNLPTLYQARFLPSEFDDYPLLVPTEAKKRANWMAALDIVSSGRDVVFIDDDRWIQVGDLVRIEGITRPNPRPLTSRSRGRVGVLVAPLLDYRNFVLTHLGLDLARVSRGNRVFIGRRLSEVRGYNQEEIFAVAEGYGFERVYLEDLTFEDSVRVFREAEIILGPHGAGWANMLFCHSATKAMLWTWEGEEQDNWYENIAYVAEVSYLQLCVPVIPEPRLDRRRAEYHLDSAVFEQGLRSLLGRSGSTGRR